MALDFASLLSVVVYHNLLMRLIGRAMESLNVALTTSNSGACSAQFEEGSCFASRPSSFGDVVVTVGEGRTQPNPAALVSGGGSLRRAALESLSRSEAHSSQLKEWRDEDRALRSRKHRKEQNQSAAQSEIYQLLGLFSLFQGVIFTALAQSTILTCSYWWSPFALSLTVMAATLVALQQKLKAFYDVQAELVVIGLHATALFDSIEELKTKGRAFDLADLHSQPGWNSVQQPRPQYCSRLSRLLFEYTYAFAVIGTVLFLSAIILVSCRSVLCGRGCSCSR